MYCIKCGKQIPDGSKYCNFCGFLQAVTPPVEQVEPSPETSVPEAPKKKLTAKKIVIICCAAAAVIAVCFFGYQAFGFGIKKISALNDYSMTFSGYSNLGSCELDTEKNTDYTDVSARIQELTYQATDASSKGNTKDYEKYSQELNDLVNMMSSLKCTTDYGDKVNGKLANGDQLKVSCTFDTSLVKSSGFEFKDLEHTYTVNGLEELKEVDLFADVTVEWEYMYGFFPLMVNNNSTEDTLQYLTYTAGDVDSDGNVTVTLDISEDTLNSLGYTAKDGKFSKEYHVGTKPEVITEADTKETEDAAKMYAEKALETQLNGCGKILYQDDEAVTVKDYVFDRFESYYDGIGVIYKVNLSNGESCTKSIDVIMYKMPDGSFEDHSNESTGCEIGTFTGYWY